MLETHPLFRSRVVAHGGALTERGETAAGLHAAGRAERDERLKNDKDRMAGALWGVFGKTLR